MNFFENIRFKFYFDTYINKCIYSQPIVIIKFENFKSKSSKLNQIKRRFIIKKKLKFNKFFNIIINQIF